jgi:hypothetical protein
MPDSPSSVSSEFIIARQKKKDPGKMHSEYGFRLSGGLCMASKTFVLEDIVQRIPTRRPNGSRTYPNGLLPVSKERRCASGPFA